MLLKLHLVYYAVRPPHYSLKLEKNIASICFKTK